MGLAVPVPVRTIHGENWGHLGHFADVHEIIGYDFRLKKQNFTVRGNHRVRLYKVKGNVHWKIPPGPKLYSIKDIPKGTAPGQA